MPRSLKKGPYVPDLIKKVQINLDSKKINKNLVKILNDYSDFVGQTVVHNGDSSSVLTENMAGHKLGEFS